MTGILMDEIITLLQATLRLESWSRSWEKKTKKKQPHTQAFETYSQ